MDGEVKLTGNEKFGVVFWKAMSAFVKKWDITLPKMHYKISLEYHNDLQCNYVSIDIEDQDGNVFQSYVTPNDCDPIYVSESEWFDNNLHLIQGIIDDMPYEILKHFNVI